MTRKEISVEVFQRHRSAEQLAEALDFLEQLGRITAVKEAGPKGRPAVRYFARVPAN